MAYIWQSTVVVVAYVKFNIGNQGWVGQTSSSGSTYINNFGNNNYNMAKPSVLNATMVMKENTYIKPFTTAKHIKTYGSV